MYRQIYRELLLFARLRSQVGSPRLRRGSEAGDGNNELLKALMGDTDARVSAAAAVSLLLLRDDAGRAQLLKWAELDRVRDLERLAFLREPLAACRGKERPGAGRASAFEEIFGRPRR